MEAKGEEQESRARNTRSYAGRSGTGDCLTASGDPGAVSCLRLAAAEGDGTQWRICGNGFY